jgi:hypothetical protein
MSEMFKPLRPTVEHRETEFKNVSQVETEVGKFKIMYSLHNFVANPKIVEGSDGIVLELLGETFDEAGMEKSADWIQEDRFSPYKEVVREAAEKHVPVFLTDLSLKTMKSKEFRGTYGQDVFKEMVEKAFGAMGVFLSVNVLLSEKMSRRDFLKKGAMAVAALGAYASFPLSKDILGEAETSLRTKEIDETSVLRKGERLVDTAQYHTHPETRSLMVDARNDLFAQKSETIARSLGKSLGRKPSIAIVIGAGHVGLERSLQKSGDDRLGFIREKLGSNIGNEKLIARLDFSDEEEGGKRKVDVSFIQDPNIGGK